MENQIEVTLTVWAVPRASYMVTEQEPDRFELRAYQNDDQPYRTGSVKLTEQTVTIAVPTRVDIVGESIAAMELSIRDEYVSSAQRIEVVRQQIAELQCLEHNTDT